MPTHSSSRPTYQLILIGLLSSAFFSATFIMNYVMHLDGGHWAWSAALRFLFMLMLLFPFLLLAKGTAFMAELFQVFFKNLVFWLIAGTIGFGVFYAGICYAADYSRGWLVAATWQSTVLASPLVLVLFGLKMPTRGILLSIFIVLGVVLVNYAQFKQGIATNDLLYGVIPVLISAFAYPIGNQMLNGAKTGSLKAVKKIDSTVLTSSAACVFLMSLGSVPFWLLLVLYVQPPPPSAGQIYGSLSVALFSGVCATSLFYWARNSTTSAMQIAAVDATLAGEVIVTLIAEMLFLKQPAPDALSMVGLVIITLGLIGYCYRSAASAPAKPLVVIKGESP
ncbi:multidrug resistance efflux transporter family protein [Pseudomonas sp. dw_612]|uniref:multidrug resistance efflux transporter family protein n=1 Tax=Pseudomonas sp. dw_612 TaxID=2720080 RepID=UPI001BD5DA2D|nr:multidrug resistance efflux transporter family protein [Pseudomonas sp. dw_612]